MITTPLPSQQQDELVIHRIRHETQIRPLNIIAVTELTPHMRRLTLAGESLASLHSDGFDDHVKLLLPALGERALTLPPIGEDGRPDWAAVGSGKPLMRDYTPRRIDRAARTLDIDFTLHGEGPAALWAAQAQVGDPVLIAGPRGSMVVPTDLQWQWLIGDDSALPAIARRLEELADDVAITVVVECHDDSALPPMRVGPNCRVLRVQRPAAGDAGRLVAPLLAALRQLPTPAGRGHAFAAAESATVKAVRDVLVAHHHLRKDQIRASAYWRRGDSGHHENIE